MSTILRALRRLEEERETGVLDLRGQVVARPRQGPARPRLALLVASGAVGAVLVVGGFVFLEGRVEPAHSDPAPLATRPASTAPLAARPASTAPLAARPASTAPRSVPSASFAPRSPTRTGTRRGAPAQLGRQAPRRAVAAIHPPAPAAVSGAPAHAAPAAVSGAPAHAAPAAVSGAPAHAAPAAVSGAPAHAAPAAVSGAPAHAAPAAVSGAPAHPAPVQRAAALPLPVAPVAHEPPGIAAQPEVARRAPFPRVVVERTLWHPKPARRVAFLQVEGRSGTVELHEGDAVGDAVVQQIAPSSVIFLHRGVEIRRRVGAED